MGSDLQNAKDTVSDWITDVREDLSTGYFSYNGHQWGCADEDRENLTGVNVLGLMPSGLPAGLIWTDYNNNFVPVDLAYVQALAYCLYIFVTACYVASYQHLSNVANITTTAADVYAYDYTSTLWPDPNAEIVP